MEIGLLQVNKNFYNIGCSITLWYHYMFVYCSTFIKRRSVEHSTPHGDGPGYISLDYYPRAQANRVIGERSEPLSMVFNDQPREIYIAYYTSKSGIWLVIS